jgi:hypothetical protein
LHFLPFPDGLLPLALHARINACEARLDETAGVPHSGGVSQ